VMDMGTASIDRSVLWRSDEGWKLADYLSCDNVRCFKKYLARCEKRRTFRYTELQTQRSNAV
ncbi:hypothetical protein F7O73_11225, partial [Neisseria meningitidis]|nr:hypothetical protein [Neisseria meningitidis]